MNSDPTPTLSGLAASLVRQRLLDEKTALSALEQSRKHQTPFVTHLVRQQLAQGVAIARLASQEFNLPLLDIEAMSLESAPTALVKADLILRHGVLPLRKHGNRLFVGLADPTHSAALEDIEFQTGLRIEPVIAVEPQLTQAIERLLNKASTGIPHPPQQDFGPKDAVTSNAPTENYATDADDSSIKRFVNRTLLDAIHRGASDVHFEPYEKNFRVRFRQDGLLHEIVTPPTSMAPRIVARVKVMARLNIAEHRIPQDGGMRMQLSPQRAIDFRVNILPTAFGEKVVLRILDPSSARLGIDVLGYEARQKELFLEAIHQSQGMVLVTGPTGSGKTVSMYTALNILNTPEVNISTVEDPVEINLGGINQVNVNPKTGMTFANALRAFLRQDPDIVMVGEIRDLETAEIAIKAAQTGHMVLSTLHTNNAPQTLTRLMNMGVAPYNIASSVTLIVAQRLARRLCHHCKAQDPVPPEELLNQGFAENDPNDLTVFRAVGCDRCALGYKGRIGIYEVMPVSAKVSHLIMAGGNALELAEQARREGIDSLRQSGLRKVRAGLVSLEELNRVTKD